MTKRFSSQLLYKIRNEIALTDLLPNILDHPCKYSEGFMRFLCPECLEFNSAINGKNNLARCFACKKNFNSIEFVMKLKKLSFPKAIYFLQPYLPPHST